MVNPVLRGGGRPPIAVPKAAPFPSAISQPDWATIPNYNSPIMDTNNNTLGIPWYSLLNFVSIRASYLQQINTDVTTLQGQVTTLQSQVSTLQSQVSTLQSQVSTLNSQVTTLQGQVSTLQSQMSTANSNISTLQGQMNTLLTVTVPNLQAEDRTLQNEIDTINTRLANAGIP